MVRSRTQATEFSLVFSVSIAFVSLFKRTSVVYWSDFLAADPEVRVRFPVLPEFLRSNGSGTASTQPNEYN
jgi:hypothetical protein